MRRARSRWAVALILTMVGALAVPGAANAAPSVEATVKSDTFDYRPLKSDARSATTAQPRRLQKPTLDSLRQETRNATASYQSEYKPTQDEISTQAWSPPSFAYDFIEPSECENRQDVSGTAQGWIKNHYAFCRIYKAERGLEQCRPFIGCVTYRASFWVTTIGYGSERERRIRFLTQIDHISVTTQVGGFPAQENPALAAATVVTVENECAALIQPEDCQLQNNANSRTTQTLPLTLWRNINYFYTDMLSTAPGVSDANPDQLGFTDFWNDVKIRWPLNSGATERESERQTVRFDTNTYLNLNGRNGGIFSKVRPIIHFPVNEPFWAPMRLSGEHYQLAMTKPELTIPRVTDKKIPGIEGGDPLTRLYRDTARRTENRNTAVAACVQEWGTNYPEGGFQCDEFPFASTREGAATTYNPGRNFSVQRLPGPDNEAAGTWLGAWYSYDRILDGDIFNVNVTL
jgi:hypothetical protein